MTTYLLARIDALLATVVLRPGMVATAQQSRDRGILEVLREMAVRLEALESGTDMQAAVDVGEGRLVEQRLAALEAWKETQTGDGK